MLKDKKGFIEVFICITILVVFALLILFGLGLRLDFAGGSHRITPTAVDNDFWGNYIVYFKTSEYTQNTQESYYCIDKGDIELAEEMKDYIKQGKDVMVYYDKYVGWKGISSCGESPITKIEAIND